MPANRRFVIGDIHGCIKSLDALLYEELKITKDDEIFFVGDFIDRGPANKAVLDRVMAMKSAGWKINAVLGNHEYMMKHSVNSPKDLELWQKNGAASTFRDFNASTPHEIPQEYFDFIGSLPYYIELEDFIIAHAGLNCSRNNPFTDIFSMVWTRDEYVDPEKTGGRRVIAGHTPHSLDDIRRKLANLHIPIDGGCVYYGKLDGMGHLCAFEMNSEQLFYVRNSDFDI